MKLKILVGIALFMTSFNYASAAEVDWKVASLKFIDDTVVPAYDRFIRASHTLKESSIKYCETGTGASSSALIETYHQTADAWQAIQIYRSGPAQVFMRHDRIQTWPGVSKIASKQLRQLLAAEDESALDAVTFRKSSTALQGLPALERLLFAEETLTPKSYACRVVVTIAENLQIIGEEAQADWNDGHKLQIKAAGGTDSYLSSAEDVAAELLTDFYTQVYAIEDQKLGRPYAKTRFRIKRAESWRSRRSLRNVRVNIESAEQYYTNLFMPAMASRVENLHLLGLFKKAREISTGLGDDFSAANEINAEEIQQLRVTLDNLRKIIQFKMPGVLGITIGFNALDGDG